jgi:hypothetical protein
MKRTMLLATAVLFLLLSNANAETIRVGPYSGRPGYFAKVGGSFQLTLNAIVMNKEVAQKLRELRFGGLGSSKECEVSGTQQVIGYTIFEIVSCK